jgi:hypothetical protein
MPVNEWPLAQPQGDGASSDPLIGCRADRQDCGTSPLDDPRRAAHDLAEDCGRVIDPMIVDGQVCGAVAQGI